MVTVTRSISVAAGVFAPGHLGELTQVVPFELVDAVPAQAGRTERRVRVLPSRVGVYFLLAMCLFPQVGYRLVWAKMVAGLGGPAAGDPCAKALRDLRRRVGPDPVRALFEVLAGPLGRPGTPGVLFAGYRTVSFDGCSSQKVPDTVRNRAWLGGARESDGYPRICLMTLVETGTRALAGAVFGTTGVGEIAYATRLLHLLDDRMLVLWDRGFDSADFLAAVHATGAKLLGRATGNRRPPVLARLADGSYRSRIGGVAVRVIEAEITVRCQDGTVFTGTYRLVTTLLCHRRHPAGDLVRCYHERWEHESAYYALRHTMLDGRILRSGDPAGLEQELWALLCLYQALRTAMLDAVEHRPGTDPDRAAFTVAHQHARDQLIKAEAVAYDPADRLGPLGRAVLKALLPPRRIRVSTRKIKSTHVRYHVRRNDGRPLTSQNVTALEIAVLEPTLPGPAPDTGPPPAAHADTGPRLTRVLALMHSDPNRAWHAAEIAHRLDAKSLNAIRVDLSKWSHKGHLLKTGPAIYTLPPTTPTPLTANQNP
jgi:hypothetical protein